MQLGGKWEKGGERQRVREREREMRMPEYIYDHDQEELYAHVTREDLKDPGCISHDRVSSGACI